MEELYQDITIQIRLQKQVITMTNVENTSGCFKLAFRRQISETTFVCKLLPITDSTKFEDMLNNENYKKTIKTFMVLVGKIIHPSWLKYLCYDMDVVLLYFPSSMIKLTVNSKYSPIPTVTFFLNKGGWIIERKIFY